MGEFNLFWVLWSTTRPVVSYRDFGKGEFSVKCFNLVDWILSMGVLGALLHICKGLSGIVVWKK